MCRKYFPWLRLHHFIKVLIINLSHSNNSQILYNFEQNLIIWITLNREDPSTPNLYIFKSWSVAFIVTMLHSPVEPHHHHVTIFFFFGFSFHTFSIINHFFFLSTHHLPIINFWTYFYKFSNLSPPFYLFISPLLSTLISLFHYPFIFLIFFAFQAMIMMNGLLECVRADAESLEDELN